MDDKTYKELIMKQYRKCVENPVHFMKNYCYVQHSIDGRILFSLYEFQERTLLDIIDKNRNIILKGRQLGLSTLVAAYAL